MLNEQYVKILDATVLRSDLRLSPQTVEIKDNCATCLMSVDEYYKINLCKYGKNWKVNGENGIYASKEKIEAAEKKLNDYKAFLKEKPARDSVMKVVNNFFNGVKSYFKTQETDYLESACDSASLDLVKRIYAYAKQRTGLNIVIEEMEKPNYFSGDLTFSSKEVVYKFYKEDRSLTLNKVNDSYKITGFNGLGSSNISQEVINNRYLDFLRALKLIRSEQFKNPAIK